MIGNKLYNLIQELSVSQHKSLLYKCANSSDKRMHILRNYLQDGDPSHEGLNIFLEKEVLKTWPNSSQKEQELKVRRLSNYFADQIEQLLLDAYLEKNSSVKNLLLAESLEKSGNLNILKHYYEKAYSKSLEEKDAYYQMLSLKGRIRMNYASQSEKELEQALHLNEELLRILRHANDDKITEYYYNISNIYLEKNALVADRKEKLENEILDLLKRVDYKFNRVSLYVSLAKLNFDNEQLHYYFNLAKETLQQIKDHNEEYEDLERKIRFLELRLNFFSGKDIQDLLDIADDIVKDNKSFSIINNNTLFYKILFLILNNQVEEASEILNDTHGYFKGNGKLLEGFLVGLIATKQEDYKKALQTFQPIMYTGNYFFAVFSRLIVTRIYLIKGNVSLAKSLLESTNRLVKINQGNTLGKAANEYIIKQLKRKAKGQKVEKQDSNSTKLTVLHKYILSE